MKCHFVVGQKVQCIKDEWESVIFNSDVPGPRRGDVVTIRAIVVHEDEAYLALQEQFSSRGYLASGFRPLTERKTDISIFKAMLNPTRSAVPA